MKGKLLGCIVVIAAIMVIKSNVFTKKEAINSLALENIEALAAGEDSNKNYCLGVGDITCPRTGEKVLIVNQKFNLE